MLRAGLSGNICSHWSWRDRVDGVVPVAVEAMPCELHGGELRVGDGDPRRVAPAVEFGADVQAGPTVRGPGFSDQSESESAAQSAHRGQESAVKKKRFSVEQITAVLQQVESGVPVGDVCRQVGISEQTLLPLEEGLRRDAAE